MFTSIRNTLSKLATSVQSMYKSATTKLSAMATKVVADMAEETLDLKYRENRGSTHNYGPGYRSKAKRRRNGKWLTRSTSRPKHRAGANKHQAKNGQYVAMCEDRVYRWFFNNPFAPATEVPGHIRTKAQLVERVHGRDYAVRIFETSRKMGMESHFERVRLLERIEAALAKPPFGGGNGLAPDIIRSATKWYANGKRNQVDLETTATKLEGAHERWLKINDEAGHLYAQAVRTAGRDDQEGGARPVL